MADAPGDADAELHHQLEPDTGGEMIRRFGTNRRICDADPVAVQGVQVLLFTYMETYFFFARTRTIRFLIGGYAEPAQPAHQISSRLYS